MTPGFLKCNCHHCDGHIEYPVESAGEVVRCPHCDLPTPLVVPGAEEDPNVVAVGGNQAKFVIAGLAVLVAIVVGAAGTVWYVDHLKKKKGIVSAPTGGKAPGVASAPDVMAPDGEWKSVNPQVRPYQAGLSAAQVKEGRYVLAGPCTDCHKIYDPVTFGKSEWDSTMSSMRGKAKLRGREFEDLKLFVRSIRQ
jgi:hypothetical protein